MASNATIDTAAAAVAGPYGPLTRVSDVDADFPTPNGNIRIKFTSNIGSTVVYLTYNQLLDAHVTLRILEQAHSMTKRVQDIKTEISDAYAVTNAFSVPHTYADLKAAWNKVKLVKIDRAHR